LFLISALSLTFTLPIIITESAMLPPVISAFSVITAAPSIIASP
jgi:hypothetical protein